MQRTPAGLPWGIPGMGEEMEGAIQHAPQPILQFIVRLFSVIFLIQSRECHFAAFSTPHIFINEDWD
jgi:hypothetical protein